jgi:hypothetical protein
LRTRTSRRRHCHGKDSIATTTIDRHRRTTAVASEDDNSHFNAAFAAAVNIAAATAVAAAITIAFTAAIAAVLALSANITIVVIAATAAATAADATATTPSPLPPLSQSLQPPPTSLHLQRSCRWLVVVSSVASHLLRCLPSRFVSPTRHAVVDVEDDCYRHRQRLPSPLPQPATMTAKSQRLSFVVVGGDDNHCGLQR